MLYNIAYFCAWRANSHCSTNPKRLRNIFGNSSNLQLHETVVKRHCLWGALALQRALISWSPASKLTQALDPLKERHLYRTVMSGRHGAKKKKKGCVCLSSIQKNKRGNFRGCFRGNSNITAVWFVIAQKQIFFPKKYLQSNEREKTLWLCMKMSPLEACWKSDLMEFPLKLD